jgi:hypothetical protein
LARVIGSSSQRDGITSISTGVDLRFIATSFCAIGVLHELEEGSTAMRNSREVA